MTRRSWFSDKVQELDSGRWVVAYWDDRGAQWLAPLNRLGRDQGLFYAFARSLRGLGGDPCVSRYKTRAGAMAAARRLLGDGQP